MKRKLTKPEFAILCLTMPLWCVPVVVVALYITYQDSVQ